MQTRSFHVTYKDRNGAIQTARASGTGSTPARQRADAIRNVKGLCPGSRNFSAVGVRVVRPAGINAVESALDTLTPPNPDGTER